MSSKSEAFVALIFPAFNPPDSFTDLLRRFREAGGVRLIVVDDGSTAEYRDVFEHLPACAVILRHEKNLGKGSAVKTALRWLLENDGECVGAVTVDADGKHRVSDVLKIVRRVRSGDSALFLGSRSFGKKVPWLITLGNRVTRWFFYLKTGLRINDVCTGLRGFGRCYFEQLSKLDGQRYEYETDMLLWAADGKIPVTESVIEVDYTGRRPLYHFHPIRDTVCIYAKLLRFTAVSFSAFVLEYLVMMGMALLFKDLPERVNLLICVLGSRAVSATYSFLLNRHIVFKSKNGLAGAVSKYFVSVALLLVASYLLLDLLTVVANVPLWLAKPAVDLVLFFANYLLQSKYIFKKKKPKQK